MINYCVNVKRNGILFGFFRKSNLKGENSHFLELFLQTKLAKKKFGMVETKAFKGGKEKGNFQEVPLQMQNHYTKGQLIS